MATSTEHYNFPKYEATDLPNLLDQYNNFADSADSTIYQQNTNIQSALTNSNSALSKANETAALVGTQTGTGTVFEQLAELNGGSTEFAPKVHTSNTGSTYGAASTAQYGHVRMASGFGDSGADVAMPISLGASLNSRVAELEEGGGGGAGGDYAPVNHASSATTYGVGSSSQYGHVKLSENVTTSAGTGVALAQTGGVALNNQISQLKSQIQSLTSQLNANPFVLQPNTTGNASQMGGSGASGTVTMNATVSPLAHVITVKGYLSAGFNPGTNRTSNEVVCFTLDRQYRPTNGEMIQLIASDQHTTQGQLTNAYVVVGTDGTVKVRFTGSSPTAASQFGNDTAIMSFVYGAETD